MSAHRLAPQPAGLPEPTPIQRVELAVLKVLSGMPLTEAAATEQIESADLADAVEVYGQAGRHALEQRTPSDWWQVYIQFDDWNSAEKAAADHILPLMHGAEHDELISRWWFMRKHPCWRLRIQANADEPAMREHLGKAFDKLAAGGRIAKWWSGQYEAETAAFGGGEGIAPAHQLFCADSRAVLNLVHNGGPGLGRRELSLLLCIVMMRAAGLEWYEQGDVWHRVAQERRLPNDVPQAKLTAMASDLRQLMLAATAPYSPLLRDGGPLAPTADWADAFRATGQALGSAAREGRLTRGLREILSYLVIFHWNRLGLPARTQSILASAARTAILDLPTHTPPPTPSTRAAEDAAARLLTRFPLLLQHRFRCPDLETHVRTVRECANSCQEPTSADERINRACTVWNLSALIAADCGIPDLAIDLCRRQFQIFRAAAPLADGPAVAALQPLVNLARLTRRSGDAEGSYRELEGIHHAVRSGGSVVIHGVSFDLDDLIVNGKSTVDEWLRDVLRVDGTRALCAAGQWTAAAEHAGKYNESGDQLHEAGQTRCIAYSLNGQVGSALHLVDQATPADPWEHAVAACLRSYVLRQTRRLDDADIAELLDKVRAVHNTVDRPTALSRTRLGLAAADLAIATHRAEAELLCVELVGHAARSADAFVAREVLTHPECRALAIPKQIRALELLVKRAGLDANSIPEPLAEDLMASVEIAESVLTELLTKSWP